MKQYVIAVKRDRRASVPANWIEQLRAIKDLHISTTRSDFQIQVDASEQAIEEARRILGELCHIEPAIPHRFP